MKVTYYCHSCFMLEIKGKKILFDPFITPNEKAKDIDVNAIKPDYILITHAHQDHMADAMTIAKQSDATLVSNFEIITWFGNQGYEKGHPMNHGGHWDFDFGTVQYVNAIHTSSFPDGSYGGNPGGFIITSGERCVYISGDTALTMDMKLFGELNQIDVAFLSIGDNFTMGPKDAVKAAEMLRTKTVIGTHFDTFGYIEIDHEKTEELFRSNRINFKLPKIGEEFEI